MAHRLAILKADDFGFIPSNFRRLIEIGRRWQLPIAIGIIGDRLTSMARSEINYFRACFEDDLVEAWNHSATHRDLTTLSYEKQLEDIKLAQSKIYDALGVRCVTFGAPYNRYNSDTVNAIQAVEEFEGAYLIEDDMVSSARIVNAPRKSLVSPEFVRPWSRDNNYQEFIRRCGLKKTHDLLTIQFHPSAWSDYGFREFERCLEYMLEEGFRFVTFSEYIEMVKMGRDGGELGFEDATSSRVLALKIDAALDISNREMKDRFGGDSRLSNFFFNRHVLGIQHVTRSLKRATFGELPRTDSEGNHSVLDIGCGAGNWLIGYGVLHPNAQLFGLDKLQPCVELTKASLAAANMSARSSIEVGSVDDVTTPFSHRFSRVLCLNAAQYMDKECLFRFAHRSLVHTGQFLLNIQTPEYFVGAAWAQLDSAHGISEEAAKRLDTIIESLARSLGIRRKHNVYAYDERELMFMAKQNGLDALVAGIEFEKPDMMIRGLPYLRTYLFENRFLVQDKDNGYSSFIGMPEDQRLKHLSDLRAHSAWRRLRELIDHCNGAIPEAIKPDLTALSYSMLSESSYMADGNHSDFVKKIMIINSGKYHDKSFVSESGSDPLVEILSPLMLYFDKSYLKALDFCKSKIIREDFDLRVFIIGAAAACRLNRADDAKSFLEEFMARRNERLI